VAAVLAAFLAGLLLGRACAIRNLVDQP